MGANHVWRACGGWGGLRRALAALLVVSLTRADGRADDAAGPGEHGPILRPSLSISSVYDDNVDFEPTGRTAAGALRARPRVELAWERGRLRTGAEVGGDLWWYPSLRRASDVFARVGGFAELELWRGLRLRVADLYAPQPVALGRPTDDTGNLVQSNRAEAALRWRHALPRETAVEAALVGTRFDGEAARESLDGSRTAVDERFRTDFTEGAASVELQRGFGRRTLAYLRAEGRERAYDELPGADFGEVGGLAGLRLRGPARTELELAGGYGSVDYHDGPTVPHVRALAQLRGEVGAGFSWRAGAERRFTSDLAANDFVENTFWLGLDKPLGDRTHLSLAFTAGIADSDSSGVSAPSWRGGEVALRRRLSRHVQGGLVLRRFVSHSSRAARDITQDRVTLELEYRR